MTAPPDRLHGAKWHGFVETGAGTSWCAVGADNTPYFMLGHEFIRCGQETGNRILATWAETAEKIAAAERTLRQVHWKHAYLSKGVLRVARHADVIAAENALLDLGVQP